jgi:hypothetical protein
MPTQLDNTWLPPETRIEGGISDHVPIDYGSGEYRYLHTHIEHNPGSEPFTKSTRILIYSIVSWWSENIVRIREWYELWAWRKIENLPKITDGKEYISMDDLLWYLRYETLTNIWGILWEKSKHGSVNLSLPIKIGNSIENIKIAHSLMHTIKTAIKELQK